MHLYLYIGKNNYMESVGIRFGFVNSFAIV